VVEKKFQGLGHYIDKYKTCRFHSSIPSRIPRTSSQSLTCIAVAMKFTAILVALTAIVSVSGHASHGHTNADRLINGLPLMPPIRRATAALCK